MFSHLLSFLNRKKTKKQKKTSTCRLNKRLPVSCWVSWAPTIISVKQKKVPILEAYSKVLLAHESFVRGSLWRLLFVWTDLQTRPVTQRCTDGNASPAKPFLSFGVVHLSYASLLSHALHFSISFKKLKYFQRCFFHSFHTHRWPLWTVIVSQKTAIFEAAAPVALYINTLISHMD